MVNNKEVLERAIRKAIEGGWQVFVTYNVTDDLGAWASVIPEKGKDWQSKITYFQPREVIIFNHDFCRAIWGRSGEAEMYYSYPVNWDIFKSDELHTTTALLSEWQYHLQMMVISPDPIAYLSEHMGEE